MAPSHWWSLLREPSTTPSSVRHSDMAVSFFAAAGVLCCSLVAGQAWGQTEGEPKSDKAAIVAAGFGYQNDVDSSITVKVYDAVSGEVLSEDVYELSIKEDRNAARAQASNGRIFAGGVGPGATDLSSFTLRVYDAKTGEFQWSGQLNLAPSASDGGRPGHMISALVSRDAVVTKIESAQVDTRQPLFLLRALDVSTGGVIWEDEFSTDGKGIAKAQMIAAHPAEETLEEAGAFDFRVRMFARDGRTILWEDRVLQWPAEDDSQDVDTDRAQQLPGWTEPITQGTATEDI